MAPSIEAVNGNGAAIPDDFAFQPIDEWVRSGGSLDEEIMPIAVIGIGFRGPGDATSAEKLWELVSEGREAWRPVPKEKWNNEAFYHPDSNRNGTVCSSMLYRRCKLS